ncbi:SDR family oxidoreductase [Microbacterium sp. zg.Y625]|uniref:SDR family NAD(P)-dependent oxidoreductase n=1 Tax=Microbacterium jiangjiandongii TaxID=3049071 RepID=UPI00214AE0E7|nr:MULTISPECIES: SDR family oxidoreductase [unclassified Microbacterium]MCR2792216.1 SDR family oxidoreductase [Microbacterium sp. zg.Y625]MCR2815005.1 SDR family oxidoreductase [Microbacterium sp. zg.Y843]WIM25019.1 SDR family oxidoreductase [Microbacterium sp. zg-Y625]
MRTVLITGASGGIGAAVARRFAGAGDRVAVHYATNHAGAEETLRSLEGTGHAVITGDVGVPDGGLNIVAAAIEAVGPLDVLVCNAAVAPGPSNRHVIGETPYEQWNAAFRQMVNVNLLGAANLAWAFANHLIGRSSPGAIVNVGSRGAFRGEPEFPAYAASKAGLHALGQSLAVALAPQGISVTSVAPGFVATPRQLAKLDGTEGDALRAQSPFGRVGTPEEIAEAVFWLASPEAAWSSGAILDANGASYLRP